jgi:sec-independent protein translocase protein TatC
MPMIPKLRRRTPEQRTGTMTLMEHLEELRHRVIVMFIAVAAGSVVGWLLYGTFIDLIREPFCDYVARQPSAQRPPTGCDLVFSGAVEGLIVKLKVVVFLGLFVALPVVLYQLWAFIMPGLTDRERKMAVPFIASSTVLFALGGLVAYITLPKGLDFLLGFAGEGFVPLITAGSFIGFVVLLTLAFGLSFEFPILLIFLGMAGVISSEKLRSWRRPAIVLIAIFAAVITPSSDPYTMLALMVPMYLFYEAAIIVIRLLKK